MDKETEALVKENLEISKANQEVLEKILWYQRLGQITSIVKWVFIIGSAVGLAYLFQPFLDQAWKLYSGLLGGSVDLQNLIR